MLTLRATNNKVEYEALVTGLRLAKGIYHDLKSKIACSISGKLSQGRAYDKRRKDEEILTKDLMQEFFEFLIEVIPG